MIHFPQVNILVPGLNLLESRFLLLKCYQVFIVICKFYLVRDPVSSTQEHLQFYRPLHLDNSLPKCKNMARRRLSQSPVCSFCLNPESLLHVVAGCQQYLDHFTWRHDSILNFIAKSLQPVINVHSSLYADVNAWFSESLNNNWWKLSSRSFFLIQSKCLYVLELTIGFNSNLNNTAERKKKKLWTFSKKWVEITDVWNL